MNTVRGSIDPIVLRTLASMGPQHAYSIAARLLQVSGAADGINQGSLYPALVRLEQQKRVTARWGATSNGREAKFYSITRSGRESIAEETRRWRQFASAMESLLAEES